jgi:16S rRNA (guanine(1405)-N(7))-methyltransferase
MSRLTLTEDEISQFTQEVLQSPKYRAVDIPEALIESLYIQESPNHKRLQDLHKAVRKKLHNIVAAYLGDSDYGQATQDLKEAFQQDEQAIKNVCTQILNSHISTQERLPFLDVFYQEIFTRVGKPQSILDLACGYHPFGLPWMNLDQNCQYFAFDIIKARVELINTFFGLLQRPLLAFQQDILIHPPQMEADIAFFFKEAHRFDHRQRGCNRDFWQALKVKHLLVSLPATSMTMRHDKSVQHRRLVYETLKDLNWSVEEFQIENELIFWIRK